MSDALMVILGMVWVIVLAVVLDWLEVRRAKRFPGGMLVLKGAEPGVIRSTPARELFPEDAQGVREIVLDDRIVWTQGDTSFHLIVSSRPDGVMLRAGCTNGGEWVYCISPELVEHLIGVLRKKVAA